MVADDTQAVDRLPHASRRGAASGAVRVERHRGEYPADKCVHELFEEQVEKTPEAVAVVFEDEQLSYGELNRGPTSWRIT